MNLLSNLKKFRPHAFWFALSIGVLGVLFDAANPAEPFRLLNSFNAYLNWFFLREPAFALASLLIAFSFLKLFSPAVVCLSALLLNQVSHIKFQMTGLPLLPSDLAQSLSPRLFLAYLTPPLAGLAALTVSLTWASGMSGVQDLKRRILFSLPGMLLLFTTLFFDPKFLARGPAHTLRTATILDSQVNTFLRLGPIFGSVAYFRDGDNVKIFSRESVLKALKVDLNLDPQRKREVKKSSSVLERPDVILLLVESFFDPLTVPNLKISRDPIRNFRKLTRSYPHGKLVVQVFGGGTANTEFEVLTGLSPLFLPQGVTSYDSHFDRPMESLASLAGRVGYGTTAVHNFARINYRRDKVYPLFGFDQFFGIEDIVWRFSYDWSGYAPDIILENELKELLYEESENPQFIFGITVGTHGPYDQKVFEQNPMQIESPYGEEINQELTVYLHQLERVDEVIGNLVEVLKTRKRPTIFFIFGDHYPAIGKEELLFVKAGMLRTKDGSLNGPFEEKREVMQPPWVQFSNYPVKHEFPELMGANCLFTEIAAEMKTDAEPAFQRFMKDFCKKHPYLNSSDNYSSEPDILDYTTLIFDRTVGSRFSVGQ